MHTFLRNMYLLCTCLTLNMYSMCEQRTLHGGRHVGLVRSHFYYKKQDFILSSQRVTKLLPLFSHKLLACFYIFYFILFFFF